MGTNSKILSGRISLIPPRDMSKITEDSHESTAYKYMPTQSKVHLADSDSPNSDSSTNHNTPTNISDSNIHQHIYSCIFNDKQDPKEIKRYDGNKNNWCKAKENWAVAISAAQ